MATKAVERQAKAQRGDEPISQRIARLVDQHGPFDQVEVLSTNVNGNFFSKRFPFNKLEKMMEDGLSFPRAMYILSTTSISMGEDIGGLGLDDGDPDVAVEFIPQSLACASLGSKPRAQILVTSRTSEPPVDPRWALEQVLERFAAQKLTPVVAFELEFTLFDRQRSADGSVHPATNPLTGETDKSVMLSPDSLEGFEPFIEEVIANCDMQGIETGAICSEFGAGQFEINFPHYDDALTAADHAQLFKRTVKSIAARHGFIGSFIAKPHFDWVGNGQHIHASIIDAAGKNIFDGGDAPDPSLFHALGGLQKAAWEAMLFWAPNINSYRRFEPENCVPTGATWAHEHRHVGFRIPLGMGGAWRIENRIPGADANCYLALAAMLSGMLHGLEHKLEPSAETHGAPDMDDSGLPLTLRDAIAATGDGSLLKDYMGADFVTTYAKHRQAELGHFDRFISPRELDWYL